MLISSKTNIITDSEVADDIDINQMLEKSKESNGFVLDNVFFIHSNYFMIDYILVWSYEPEYGLLVSVVSTEEDFPYVYEDIAINAIYDASLDNEKLFNFAKNQGCNDPRIAISRIIASLAYNALEGV